MTYVEVAWWLETNLEPLTTRVEVESTSGVREVVVRNCQLAYRRSTGIREPITIYLGDVQEVRTRAVRLGTAAIQVRWVWIEGRDPRWLQSRGFGGDYLAETSLGFRREQTAREDAEIVAAAIEHIVDLCPASREAGHS